MFIRRVASIWVVIAIAAVVILIGVISRVQAASAIPTGLPVLNFEGNSCQEILKQALNTLDATCDRLGRNKACYGNNNIKAEAANNAKLKFDTVGDYAAIQAIKSLTTSPLDTSRGTWGLSLLKLQANLPDTLPGQNVTFLVYGDTSIQNTSGDMKSFYFSSGLGQPTCKEAPGDGIVVRSPNHTEVTFTANGVQITIASTITLKASPNKAMTVDLVEGHARVSTAAGTQTLKPGEFVSVPLGGNNGLEAAGAPSVPAPSSDSSSVKDVVDAMDKVASPDAPVNTVVEGCITEISGDTLVVSGTTVKFDSGKSTFGNLNVGDCIYIEGLTEISPEGQVIVRAITFTSLNNIFGTTSNDANNSSLSSDQGNTNKSGSGNKDDRGKKAKPPKLPKPNDKTDKGDKGDD